MPQDTVDTPDMILKKPELLDRIVQRCGHPKRDVKPIVEAALMVIAEALETGETLVVPPMGKLRPVKNKPLPGGANVLTVKLRTAKNASKSVTEPADDDD